MAIGHNVSSERQNRRGQISCRYDLEDFCRGIFAVGFLPWVWFWQIWLDDRHQI
ncbi:hypothetical protein [Planktothricoides sp. SR001]|uniref:hypothetical protein n=1 Tax=Planktothricoides sp. SR001 TaxID=1705388 RepID=UPI0012E10B9F|nr:hypothetical protein [Planktothricoides sp. SR001]